MRPQGEDALFESLAKVAEAYGGTADVARLANVLSSLDLAAVPPELAVAVAETLTYVYALDQAAEANGLPVVSEPAPTSKGTWLRNAVAAQKGPIQPRSRSDRDKKR